MTQKITQEIKMNSDRVLNLALRDINSKIEMKGAYASFTLYKGFEIVDKR